MTSSRPWFAAAAGVAAVAIGAGLWWQWRRYWRRAAIRAVRRFRARIDRFKLTGKRYVTEALLGDEAIARAVQQHAVEHAQPPARVWKQVRRYLAPLLGH